MTRVAAIDCGTNSLRLLIADVDAEGGTLTDVDRRMEIVRLGAGVDATGVIAADALERTLAVTRFFAALCAENGVERLRYVATSATRDASNRNDFVAGVQSILGIEPEVIPGEEEARLSFVGATAGLADDAPDGEVLVVDIGGGSTEVVLGAAALGGSESVAGSGSGSGSVPLTASLSVDIGCVRLTERHLAGDPPTAEQLAAATADIESALDAVSEAVPLDRARFLVGLAGTVTTVTAHALALGEYDPLLIHGACLPVEVAVQACDDLIHLTREQRATLPFMHPGRVDVIGAGALIWRQVLLRVAAAGAITEVMTSEHDILDGIARSLA